MYATKFLIHTTKEVPSDAELDLPQIDGKVRHDKKTRIWSL